MWVCVSISPGRTVTFDGRLMTSASAGGFPPSLTLTILFPFTTIHTSWRGREDVPAIKVGAGMANVFFGAAGAWGFFARAGGNKKTKKKGTKVVRRRTL